MPDATRGEAGSVSAIARAPAVEATPLPEDFGLRLDPATAVFDGGGVVMGGSPLRLLRLSRRGQELAAAWNSGTTVRATRSEQLLARRLVSSGTFLPRPGPATFTDRDVTVVVPVRDRPRQLRRLLERLDGVSCIVVDDASTDQALTAEIARDAGASFIGLPVNEGPSSARNRGLAAAGTPLVAFVDSDCVPSEDWLSPLLGYFGDPLVAAVAPRIVADPLVAPAPAPLIAPAPAPPSGVLGRYEATRSALDMGPAEGLVRPLSRIPYVPGAAIVVRREVAGHPFFDPGLRGGEDVDLVWRLTAAGWDVRYVPRSTVAHEGPSTLGSWLRRRTFYGTTAGALATRHPGLLAPAEASAWSVAVWVLALARRPLAALAALATLAASIVILGRRLDGLVEEPAKVAAIIAGGGTLKAAAPALRGLTRAWAPALALGLCVRPTRRGAAAALVVSALSDWAADRGALDPVRYVALHILDDVAYGTGVWIGCLGARTVRPLVPRIVLRSRVWSSGSLRSALGSVPTVGSMR